MLTKTDIIKHLNAFFAEHDIDPNDCYISHGGSMTMLGLRETTSDIDLTVNEKAWVKLMQCGYSYLALPAIGNYPSVKISAITPVIDAHLENKVIDSESLREEEKVRYRDAKSTLIDKLDMNREKDQNDIALLRSHLA